jgi:hypothetical protein
MALPKYRLSIVKGIQSEEWSNDWLLNVPDMNAAADVAEALIDFEQHMHTSNVQFRYYRISTLTKGDRVFRHVGLNSNGLILAPSDEELPLFNCIRIDLTTLDSDPARKYFRMPVLESMQSGGELLPSTISNLNGNITSYLLNTIALDNIVTSKGNTVSGATVFPRVQMRQLTRRRKKKVV